MNIIAFKDFAPAYLGHCCPYNAAMTLYNKGIYVRRFVEFFSDHDLTDITRADIERYIHERKAADAGNPTVNRELATLKHLFHYAIELDHIEKNPVGRVRFLPEPRKPLKLPSVAEVEKYLLWCLREDPLLYDLSVIAANTGLRPGDILKIKGEDIDLDRQLLTVAISKTRSELYVPLNGKALPILKTRRQKSYRVFTTEAGEITTYYDYIFPGKNGHRKGFRRHFRKAKQATGFNYKFYILRHFFATTVLGNGADVRTVQDLLGHAKITTTERYLAVIDERPRQAVESLKWNYSEGATLFDM